MIAVLTAVVEVAFWVLLAAGLLLRYAARRPRAGAAVLLCEPLLEVVLLVVTAVDLHNGAEPDWTHGLAAVYLGFTVTHGRYLVRWADAHAAHRLGGGPPPAKPPRYGMPRAVHEWKMSGRAIGGAAIAAVLLQLAVWYAGAGAETGALVAWQQKMGLVAGIALVIAVSYTLFPKRPPAGMRTGADDPAAAGEQRDATRPAGRSRGGGTPVG